MHVTGAIWGQYWNILKGMNATPAPQSETMITWKCKRTYSSVAWRMCGSAREPTYSSVAWRMCGSARGPTVAVAQHMNEAQESVQSCSITHVWTCQWCYYPTPPHPPHPPMQCYVDSMMQKMTTVASLSDARHLKQPNEWRLSHPFQTLDFASGIILDHHDSTWLLEDTISVRICETTSQFCLPTAPGALPEPGARRSVASCRASSWSIASAVRIGSHQPDSSNDQPPRSTKKGSDEVRNILFEVLFSWAFVHFV